MEKGMALQRLSASAPLEEILAVFERDGGLIIEGMFPVATIERMRDAVVGWSMTSVVTECSKSATRRSEDVTEISSSEPIWWPRAVC